MRDIKYLIHHLRRSDIHLYEALVALNNELVAPTDQSDSVITISGSSSVTRLAVALTSNTTINPAIGPDGSLMVVEITQDATGGWLITWGANFETGLDDIIGSLPNQKTVALFYSNGSLWRMLGGLEIK